MAFIQRIEHKPPVDVLGVDENSSAIRFSVLVVTIQSFADTIHFFSKNGTRCHGSRGLLIRLEHPGHQIEDVVELVGGVGAQVCENHVGCPGGHEESALFGILGRFVDPLNHAGRDHPVALAGHEK